MRQAGPQDAGPCATVARKVSIRTSSGARRFHGHLILKDDRRVSTIIERCDITEEGREREERDHFLRELKLRTGAPHADRRIPESSHLHQHHAQAAHVCEMVNPSYLQLVGHRELIGRVVSEAFPKLIPNP